MRIMHISPLNQHPCFTDLVERQKKNHEVIFVKLGLSDKLNDCTIADGTPLTIKHVRKSYDQGYNLELRNAFNQLLKRLKPDIVHIHVFSGMSLLPILNVASSLGIKKVLTLHDHALFCTNGVCLNGDTKCSIRSLRDCDCSLCKGFAGENNMSVKEYNALRQERAEDIINQCDKIICPSHHQREQLLALFGNNPSIITLHYGVDLQPAAPKKPGPKVVFGYLGTLEKVKGISLIREALKELNPYDFEMIMGLTNPGKEQLKTFENSKITIKTNIPREKLHKEFFSQIDYLIIPSIWNETGPMTLLEAFYYKVPVIISKNQSMVEKLSGNRSSLVFEGIDGLVSVMEDIINGKVKRQDNDSFPVKHIDTYTEEVDAVYNEINVANPRDLAIRTDYLCNQNCVFCAFGDSHRGRDTPAKFDAIARCLRENRRKYNVLELASSSELTIRKDFFEIVECAYRLGYLIEIVSNGRMFFYEDICRRLADYNISLVVMCLHAPKAEIHEAMTRAKGSFSQTVAGFRNLLKLGFNVRGQVILTKLNYKSLLDTVKYMVDIGITDIRITFPDTYGNAELLYDSVVARYSDVAPFVQEAVDWLKKKKGIHVDLKSFPHCSLHPEYRPFIAKGFTTGVVTLNDPSVSFYVTQIARRFDMKDQPEGCRECVYNHLCEGIWKPYLDREGSSEFRPIKSRYDEDATQNVKPEVVTNETC